MCARCSRTVAGWPVTHIPCNSRVCACIMKPLAGYPGRGGHLTSVLFCDEAVRIYRAVCPPCCMLIIYCASPRGAFIRVFCARYRTFCDWQFCNIKAAIDRQIEFLKFGFIAQYPKSGCCRRPIYRAISLAIMCRVICGGLSRNELRSYRDRTPCAAMWRAGGYRAMNCAPTGTGHHARLCRARGGYRAMNCAPTGTGHHARLCGARGAIAQ